MERIFKSGQTVLFQGDSVTDCSRSRTDLSDLGDGYARKISALYGELFPGNGVKFVNRGISGNRVRDLLARYEEDFVALRPDFISILIGINDVWRKFDSNDPETAERFETEYRTLLEQLRRDLPRTKIMIIEPFLVMADPDKFRWHVEDMDEKIQVVRGLAREYADYFLPLDGLLVAETVGPGAPAPIELAEDGVHPTDAGHAVIARQYLGKLGIL